MDLPVEVAASAYVGHHAPQGEDVVASNLAAGGRVRLRAGPRWGLELALGTSGEALDPRADLAWFLGTPGAHVAPFATLGAGMLLGDAEGTGVFQAGVGFDLVLLPALDLRADVRYRVDLEGGTAFAFTVGPQLHTPRRYDRDGDGVADPDDRCPAAREDADGHDDADGCPDPDNDDDGVSDEADACPAAAEDRDGFLDGDGCPDPDNDGDGLPDARDACANAAEDADGFRDGDGCPDPDNDADGVADADDGCPNVPEDADAFEDGDGCPDPDNDGDGVGDRFDGAPDVPENVNGFEDGDGVPETLPPVLARFVGAVPRLRFDGGRPTERAEYTLDVLASVLASYPAVRLGIRVAHPDADAAAALALTLAGELVERGVAADRLEPEGVEGEPRVETALVP